MERKSNEEEIRKANLLARFEKISKKNENSITIPGQDGAEITITTEYNVDEFGFSPGQFIKVNLDFVLPTICIGFCVGVGKGCSKYPHQEEVWFLLENNEGVSHFCGHKAREFQLRKEEERIMLLDPVSAK